MKVRFYCDVITPYHLPKGQQIQLCAMTHPYQGRIVDGFKRYCFDVDFPPDAVVEATPIPSTAPKEVPID